MHMSDALLSPAVGGAFWAGSAAVLVYCCKKAKDMDEKVVPLMGVLGAFVFAAQMINFTIPATGSSGHLGGGLLLSVLLGPYAAFIVMASVLTVQALFFADGGLLALGCNIWNLAFFTSFIAYPLIYKPIVAGSNSALRTVFASILSAVIGLQFGSLSVVLQTSLSGRTELPVGTFLLLMQSIHLAIGIVEGIITAGVINMLRLIRPETLSGTVGQPKRLLAILSIVALLTGGVFSWFASTNPDGLEWSIEKAYGKAEIPEMEGVIYQALRDLQEATTLLPGYTFKKTDGSPSSDTKADEQWPNVDVGLSLSALVGSAIVISVVFVIGLIVGMLKRASRRI